MAQPTKPGADGLGAFSGGGGSSGASRNGLSSFDLPLEALEKADAMTGMATLLHDQEFNMKLNQIYRLYGATSDDSKVAVQAALVTYFAVHGTSPETAWKTYKFPLVVEGKPLPIYETVSIIGTGSLKQFMGRYSDAAIKLYQKSENFRKKFKERVARLGLSEDQGYMVIDYVGKDGGLDSASMNLRSGVRRKAVAMRNTDRVAQESWRQHSEVGDLTAHNVGIGVRGGGAVDPFQ